jgi:hypothetical protein
MGEMTPDDAHAANVARWARVLLTLLLARLAWSAFHDDLGSVPLISDIDAAVHEFGHQLFNLFGLEPFGHTMYILGGSLFQVVFPLIFAGYFLRKHGDRAPDVHAAMVCLWWASINMLGVAIYANDARAEELVLINGLTGKESDGHDWNNLFTTWGLLDRDTIIAARFRAIAAMTCIASILIGLYAALNPPKPRTKKAEAEPAI